LREATYSTKLKDYEGRGIAHKELKKELRNPGSTHINPPIQGCQENQKKLTVKMHVQRYDQRSEKRKEESRDPEVNSFC